MKNVVLILALVISAVAINRHLTTEETKDVRGFQFTYEVEVESTNGKKLEMWIPIPQSNEVQSISNLKINTGNFPFDIKEEKVHGNKYVYIQKEDGTSVTEIIKISFDVTRLEHSNITDDNVNPVNYLSSYTTVPTGNVFDSIISNNNLATDNIRGIYDFILSGMHYGKPKSIEDVYYNSPWLSSDSVYGRKGATRDDVVNLYQKAKSENGDYTFGNGNSIYACDIGVGNCTDYHSYFMSLGRTLDIPVRFHMGFPIPIEEEGKIGGYHCWADYYIEGDGWYPVDISEADKNPDKSDYFFGNLDQNRVEFITGRDFDLEQYSGNPVNIFIYPLLEIDDEKSTAFTKYFSYKNI